MAEGDYQKLLAGMVEDEDELSAEKPTVTFLDFGQPERTEINPVELISNGFRASPAMAENTIPAAPPSIRWLESKSGIAPGTIDFDVIGEIANELLQIFVERSKSNPGLRDTSFRILENELIVNLVSKRYPGLPINGVRELTKQIGYKFLLLTGLQLNKVHEAVQAVVPM